MKNYQEYYANRPNWWIDQNAIYYAVDFLLTAPASINFGELRTLAQNNKLPIATGETYKRRILNEYKKKIIYND